MKKFINLCILFIISIVFTGCMAAVINHATMPVEKENIKDYKNDFISDKTKADFFVFMSKAPFTNKVSVYIDDKMDEPLSSNFYLYFQVEPGTHWVLAQNLYTLDITYICKNLEAGKKEILDISQPNKSITPSAMDLESTVLGEKQTYKRKQVGQKTNKILDVFASQEQIDSIMIEIAPNNEYLSSIKKTVEESFQKLSIPKGKSLKVKISIPNSYTENLPTLIYNNYVFNNTYYYNTSVLEIIKLEFFINDKKIDEHLSTGYFNHTEGIGVNIASYIACKYFKKQYPLSPKHEEK